MRKGNHRIALTLFVLAFVSPTLALAETLAKANQKDIPKLLDAATGMNSAYRASLIGVTNDRVYFEYVTAIHASSFFSTRQKRVVYWLPRSEITDEQLTQFKTYKDRQQPGE